MTQITPRLPHQTDDIFLTDCGTETWLMYKRGFELPEFSAFHLQMRNSRALHGRPCLTSALMGPDSGI